MEEIKIIDLTQTSDYNYKSFFTTGLIAHPDCFRISPSDEEKELFPTSGQTDSFTLGAVTSSGDLCGVVSFQREGTNRERIRHKGLLFRMYVSERFAGAGIGISLINHLLEKVKTGTDIEQINLTVIHSNTRARMLYERLGFRSFSLEKKAIKFGDRYFDEEQMVLFLK